MSQFLKLFRLLFVVYNERMGRVKKPIKNLRGNVVNKKNNVYYYYYLFPPLLSQPIKTLHISHEFFERASLRRIKVTSRPSIVA